MPAAGQELDVDLRMAEDPEQVLPQQRGPARVGVEELGAEPTVELEQLATADLLLTFCGEEGVGPGVRREVLEAMRMLIEDILSEAGVGGESFMETSGLKLRELLVWQLISGYKLRELEAKQELNRLLEKDEPEAG